MGSLFPWLILTRDDVGFPILKCSTCFEHGVEGANTAYGKGGSGGRDMQKESIRTHQRSTVHLDAHAVKKSKESRKLRQALLSEFEGLDRGTLHIITALKTAVYTCKSEAPITSYVGFIKFMAELGVPNLPLDSKGSYFLEYGFGELLDAAAKYLRQEQLKQIEASPYIRKQLDESIDKVRGKDLIVYVSYMKDGASVCEFLTLLTMEKCDAASLIDVLLTLLDAVGIDLSKIVEISTDGARVMTGTSNGVVARLRARNPYLVSCHCIAHREALAARDAALEVPEFNIVDHAVRNVAEQMSRSSIWDQRFLHLQEYICDTNLELQGIHAVRWLSRGEAVKRFAKVLPATIVLLHDFKHELYEAVTSFKFHFMLYFLAGILAVLNDLNTKFQQHQVDITVVAGEVSLACRTIEVCYVDCEDRFDNDQSPMLGEFLKKHGNPGFREVTVEGVDRDDDPAEHTFTLHERPIPGHKSGGDCYSCKAVCQEFAKECIGRLEFRLEDLKDMAG
ncbi:unnamed protein product [Closterium sp. Naga37s-1]|nr:unnamed protein product [Closterium sp. Naga37s-1]